MENINDLKIGDRVVYDDEECEVFEISYQKNDSSSGDVLLVDPIGVTFLVHHSMIEKIDNTLEGKVIELSKEWNKFLNVLFKELRLREICDWLERKLNGKR